MVFHLNKHPTRQHLNTQQDNISTLTKPTLPLPGGPAGPGWPMGPIGPGRPANPVSPARPDGPGLPVDPYRQVGHQDITHSMYSANPFTLLSLYYLVIPCFCIALYGRGNKRSTAV